MATRIAPQQPAREDYSALLMIGIGLALLVVLGTSIYMFTDNLRLKSAADQLLAGRVSRGKEIFTSQCAACHGQNGEGGVGPALNSLQLLKTTQDSIFFSVIRSGVPNTQMPSWSVDFGGPLTDEDIRDAVAFIRAWEPTAPEIKPAVRAPDPAQGAVLFASTCAICHGENGHGGKPGIPAINDPTRLSQFDDNWYRQTIANGRPAKGMPTWGTVLSPAQLDDLVALIAAWRSGQNVTPSFSVPDLIDKALFSLSQGDTGSAQLQTSRALEVAKGPGSVVLQNALSQIQAGDLSGAQATLQALKDQWPLGDASAGALVFSENCAPCHGAQGEGGIGLPLHPSAFVGQQTNAQLLDFILTGRPGTAMAGFKGRLDETQIANVIAFLRLWQK